AWYARASWRARWVPMTLGALAAIIPILGLLDFLTWGSPFQSVWMSAQMNLGKGVATVDFGADPPLYYFVLLSPSQHSFLFAVVFGALAAAGTLRARLLALSALALVITHSFIGHKEFRFICFALLAMPVFLSLGIATAGEYVKAQFGRPAM